MADTLKSVALNRLVLMVATAVATSLGTLISVSYPMVFNALCSGAA